MFRGFVTCGLLLCLQIGCGGATRSNPHPIDEQPASAADGGAPSMSASSAGETSAPSAGESGASSAGEAGASNCGCVNATIEWWVDSNQPANTERGQSHIAPCSTYGYESGPIGKPPTSSCTMPLSGCDRFSGVDAVNAALANPDVVSALAHAPEVFGVDRRADGGQADHIQIDGKVITVGNACPKGDRSCNLPRGVADLDGLLGQIQMLSCMP